MNHSTKIPTNKKHIIKHIIFREKCTKNDCCTDVDRRIKTHHINKYDITYGSIVLSKDIYNLLRSHVKTNKSQQQIFSLQCDKCFKDIDSKYIYSDIIKNHWFFNYGFYNFKSQIFSGVQLNSKTYLFHVFNAHKINFFITISLKLLETLNINHLIYLASNNIKIKRDAFSKIKKMQFGHYMEDNEYNEDNENKKNYDDLLIKHIPNNNQIEELKGLYITHFSILALDKFKFLKVVQIDSFNITWDAFQDHFIQVVKHFYKFPLINFIFCCDSHNNRYILKNRNEIKKFICENDNKWSLSYLYRLFCLKRK